jgi:hypothetical protein
MGAPIMFRKLKSTSGYAYIGCSAVIINEYINKMHKANKRNPLGENKMKAFVQTRSPRVGGFHDLKMGGGPRK